MHTLIVEITQPYVNGNSIQQSGKDDLRSQLCFSGRVKSDSSPQYGHGQSGSWSLGLSPSLPLPLFPLFLSLTHTHIHRYLSFPNTCVSLNQKMIPYGLQGMYVHAHTQGYIFPLDPTIHVTQHTCTLKYILHRHPLDKNM